MTAHRKPTHPSLFGISKPRRKVGQPTIVWFTPYQRHMRMRDILGDLSDRMDRYDVTWWFE
jgi:hypothetical protein